MKAFYTVYCQFCDQQKRSVLRWQVYTMNLVSLYTASASGEACVVTATSQILAAARRSLANQHRQPVSASSATSNLLGVVLFLPEIDKLLARLPSVACHHLIDRLVEVTTMTTASDSAKRRIILVATVTNLPNWPSLMMSNEEIQSFSRTGPLSIRVPSAGVSPRAPPGVATLGGGKRMNSDNFDWLHSWSTRNCLPVAFVI